MHLDGVIRPKFCPLEQGTGMLNLHSMVQKYTLIYIYLYIYKLIVIESMIVQG